MANTKTPKLPSPASLPWHATPAGRTPVPNVIVASASLKDAEHLTAAATLLSPRPVGRPSKADAGKIRDIAALYFRSIDMGWQTEVFAAYGQVPELHYVMNSIARAASQAIIVPDTSASTDGPESATTSATNPSRPAEAIPVGNAFRAALLLSLVGEYYLISKKNDLDARNAEVLSPLEVRWDKNTGLATLPGSWGVYNPTNLSVNSMRLTRVHQPDAAVWLRADSSARAALPVLRELIGHTMAVSAVIDSRIVNAGLFYYPAGMGAAAPPDGTGKHDADMPLGDALLDAFETAIENPGSASARVPVMAEIPDDVDSDKQMGFIDFSTKQDEQTKDLIDQDIRRLAIALDAPAEILLGMQNTTSHFATWAVQDDFVRMHIEPLLEIMVDGYNVHVDGNFTFDVSPLQRRANLGVEAIQLYDRGVISARSVRLANGFTSEDAPADPTKDFDTAAWEKLEAMIQKSPSLAQTPGLPAVLAQIKACMRNEAPDNAIYPGKSIEVSEDETPRADGAPVSGKDDPRAAPPAAAPKVATPRADGSPNGGSKGRPADLPSTNT